MKNNARVKIIGGRFRGRWIEFPDTKAIRPTPNRLRETLFNWLMHFIPEALCLDGFSGSGALGFEALSRGAKNVYAIEKNPACIHALCENTRRLNVKSFEMIEGDFFEKIPQNQSFNIVFLDPPFRQNLFIPALICLVEKKSLAKTHRIYFEVEKEFDLSTLPSHFEILKNHVAGQVRYGLLYYSKQYTQTL